MTREKFENTLAHELHHIGYAGSCPSKQAADEIGKLPPHVRSALTWIGAFGEGFAMLAAAGGPEIHPHAVSNPEERARWDKDVANFNEDFKKVEKFLLDVLEKKTDWGRHPEDGIFFLRHAGTVVHRRLEDVGTDRENLRAGEVDRVFLRSTETVFNLQRGGPRNITATRVNHWLMVRFR